MRRQHRIPDRSEITDDTALLLDVAAQIAFPDGTVSGLTLRRAARREELQVEHLGGRVYTTLANIDLWRERCRQPAKRSPRQQPDDGSDGRAAMASAMQYIRDRKEALREEARKKRLAAKSQKP